MIDAYTAALASHAVMDHLQMEDDDGEEMDTQEAMELASNIDHIWEQDDLRHLVWLTAGQDITRDDCEQVRQIILAEYERSIGRV